MKKTKIIISIIISVLFIVTSISTFATQVTNKRISTISDERPYDGTLRIYIVEPISRWNNYDEKPYHYGFLDFGLEEELSIYQEEEYIKQVTWIADEAGYEDVTEKNIMAIAAIFNPLSTLSYAYPPFSNPFDAYYVDAAAAAKPGETGHNIANEEVTHTVFCEEATATWCAYCPQTAESLKNVYDQNKYPFYFVAMISDKVESANNRLTDHYNLYGYPTCFFDGGYKTTVGSISDDTVERRVNQSSKRDVHELDLSISVGWATDGILDIEVQITNNEKMPDNKPPQEPMIQGPTEGKKNQEYQFTIVSSDPEGQKLYYWTDWGDESNTGWIGPYYSGEEIKINHSWDNRDTFTIKTKAKDLEDVESEWSEMQFSTPRTRFFNKLQKISFLKYFFEMVDFFL